MVHHHRLLLLLAVLVPGSPAQAASDVLLVRSEGVHAIFRGCAEAPDGSRMLVGTLDAGNHLMADDTFVMRIDRLGRAELPSVIGGDAWEDARDVVALSDGWLVAGVISSTDDRQGSAPWLVLLDVDGRPRREIVAEVGAWFVVESLLVPAPGGSLWAMVVGDPAGVSPWLVSLDASGEVAWERRITVPLTNLREVLPKEDGGCVLVGRERDEDGWLTGRFIDVAADGSVTRVRRLALPGGHVNVDHAWLDAGGDITAYGSHASAAGSVAWSARVSAAGIERFQVSSGGERVFTSTRRPDGRWLLGGRARGPQPRMQRASADGTLQSVIAMPGAGEIYGLFSRDRDAWALGYSLLWDDTHLAAMLARVDTGDRGRRGRCMPEVESPLVESSLVPTMEDLPPGPSAPLAPAFTEILVAPSLRVLSTERPCPPFGPPPRAPGRAGGPGPRLP